MVGGVTLLEFLEARLAEDEASDWPHRPTCQMLKPVPPGLPFPVFTCNYDAATRWMREIEAKRAIVEECRSTMDWVQELRQEGQPAEAYAAHVGTLLGVLKTLANVWSDHPDYDPTWSPS